MLAVIMVGLATVMGYALLASTAMQAQITDTSLNAAHADCLAESGVNLAMYYLQNPNNAPLTAGQTYWQGQNDVAFGSSVSGTCDITVAQLSPTTYRITSNGKPMSTDTNAITRAIRTEVQLGYDPSVDYAVGANADLTLPASVTVKGDMRVKGLLRLLAGAAVEGLLHADSLVGALLSGSIFNTNSASAPAPVPVSIPNFKTYAYGGNTYAAVALAGDLQNITLGPTATNPAGVYYWAGGNKKLAGNVTINGTLIHASGNLQISGANNVVTPAVGFPAFVSEGQIVMAGPNRDVTFNGMVYVKIGISRSGGTQSGSKLIINGGLLFCGTNPTIDTAYNGTIKVTYDSSKLVVAGVGSASLTPKNVAVLNWEQ